MVCNAVASFRSASELVVASFLNCFRGEMPFQNFPVFHESMKSQVGALATATACLKAPAVHRRWQASPRHLATFLSTELAEHQ